MRDEAKALMDTLEGMTSAQIRSRLAGMIDAEYRKPHDQADTRLISSCEDLLCRLYGAEPCLLGQWLPCKLSGRLNAKRLRKRAVCGVAAMAALLMLLVVSDGLFHWVGLVGGSVNREQQYGVSAITVDPGLVQGSAADGNLPTLHLATDSLEKAVEALGYTPALPSWLPDGYESAQSYSASYGDRGSVFTADWQRGDDLLRYTVARYWSPDEARAALPKTGQSVSRGETVYWFSQDSGQSRCVWQAGYAVFSLEGALTAEEMLRAAQSVVPAEELEWQSSSASFDSSDWDMLEKVAGFEIEHSDYVPQGFSLERCALSALPDLRMISAIYVSSSGDARLHYLMERFGSPEDAQGVGGYEQNCAGRYQTVNGVRYYIAYNCERPFCLWTEGMTSYYIGGHIAEEELLRMAVSANGGDPMRIALGSVRQPVAQISDAQAADIARSALQAKYGASLQEARTHVYHLRLSETRSDTMVEFSLAEEDMWRYAARVNAQTGEIVAAVNSDSWNEESGALLLEIDREEP